MSDTGWINPGTMASDDTVGTVAWSNPDNAKTSNDSRSISATADGPPDPTTILDYYAKIVKSDGSIGTTNKAIGTELDSSDTYRTYGSSTEKWGETWSNTDVNDSDFGFVFSAEMSLSEGGGSYTEYLKATNFSFSVPTGATIDGIEVRVEQQGEYGMLNVPFHRGEARVDHIQIKVYYTEGGTPTVGAGYPLPPFKNS